MALTKYLFKKNKSLDQYEFIKKYYVDKDYEMTLEGLLSKQANKFSII